MSKIIATRSHILKLSYTKSIWAGEPPQILLGELTALRQIS